MVFMDDMKDKFSRAGRSTVRKAKDLSEIAKLNSAISDAETRITELYVKIGYEIYRIYRDDPLPEVAELIGEVLELHGSVESYKLQIQAINAVSTCPQCGAKIKSDMAFCSGCGFKLAREEKPEEGRQAVFCSNCGTLITDGYLFCTVCGKKVD